MLVAGKDDAYYYFIFVKGSILKINQNVNISKAGKKTRFCEILAQNLNLKPRGMEAELKQKGLGRREIVRLNRKKMILLGAYMAFNLLALTACARVGVKLGSVFRINLGAGEIVGNLLALLLPSPF